MEFSKFGNRFTRDTGARQLMDDRGAAMGAEGNVMVLRVGNPAHIPEVLELLAQRTRDVAANPREFRRMVADYSSPAGEHRFRAAIASLLQREHGWDLGPQNIVLTGQPDFSAEGCEIAADAAAAMALAGPAAELMVIGGERVYAEFLPDAGRIYLTRVHATIDGDRFFPALHETDWELAESEEFAVEQGRPLAFSFQVFERRN